MNYDNRGMPTFSQHSKTTAVLWLKLLPVA